ncbi:class I SAM-dependent methyltransferase family protein [Natronomonas gomsonensis]|uniref:class I SAM-dependent methyltransferase n=1 Tax=Natronomonas gomsonensis TaxID=1046043 RepID=UPI0015BAA97F|nr:class I SAM-dependent methyltransferase family protein [Natronomonas gomsonensis]
MTGGDGNDLAAVVEKSRTQTAIDALRAEGVYDSGRSVEPYDGSHIAVPVTEAPQSTAVTDVRPLELPRRERGLDDLLADRGFSASEIDAAPGSWAVIGSVILADFGDVSAEGSLSADRREAAGEALLDLHGEADTVLARGGIDGTRRDPTAEVVAGTGDTETIHVEHGTKYAVDLSRVMFSPGNKAERARMGEVVESDERVFDMFAGIGYFALPMARAGAEVTAAEIDPDSYRLLVENAMLNGVSERFRAVLGDCRNVETTADRVVMGYYEAADYLDAALESLVSGGTLHLHEATPEKLFPERPIARLEAAADGRSVDVLDTRVVKSHSAGVVHGVVDARVD